MKTKDADQSKLTPHTHLQKTYEDFVFEQAEMGWEEDQRKEEEEFVKEVKNLTKSELIQLIRDARYEAEQFSGWLLQKNWSNSEIEKKLDLIKLKEKERIKKLTKGRQDQAIKKTAQTPQAKALGIDDFYKLIQEAITIYNNQDDAIKTQYPTEISGIRKIIVDLLCQPNRSCHLYGNEKWTKIVLIEIKSNHINTAKNQLNKHQTEAT